MFEAGLAIIGISSLAGAVLAILSLRCNRRGGGRAEGYGFAIAGLALSAFGIFFCTIVTLAIIQEGHRFFEYHGLEN